jgi:hypothetical protein
VTYAGNYATLTGLNVQDLIPRYILPAITDDSR